MAIAIQVYSGMHELHGGRRAGLLNQPKKEGLLLD
jgi:hypothetical protein